LTPNEKFDYSTLKNKIMENKKWTRKEAEQIKEHKYEQPSIEISDSELTFEECEDSSDDDWENWENSPNEFFDDDEDATGCKKLIWTIEMIFY